MIESFIDGKGWQWDTMDQRTAWLRQTLPADEAGKIVGRFLGSLLPYDSDLAIKAYEREPALGSPPDPQLDAAFASALGERGGPKSIRAALRIIETMPEGPKRENAMSLIENNGRYNPAGSIHHETHPSHPDPLLHGSRHGSPLAGQADPRHQLRPARGDLPARNARRAVIVRR